MKNPYQINTYDIFQGEELKIAEKIQQRRLQMLVHSCIYYEMNKNIISDKAWDSMAKELVVLQKENPAISEKVMWYDAFKDWDGSTGMDLPLKNEWVMDKARKLLYSIDLKRPTEAHSSSQEHIIVTTKPKKVMKKSRLF